MSPTRTSCALFAQIAIGQMRRSSATSGTIRTDLPMVRAYFLRWRQERLPDDSPYSSEQCGEICNYQGTIHHFCDEHRKQQANFASCVASRTLPRSTTRTRTMMGKRTSGSRADTLVPNRTRTTVTRTHTELDSVGYIGETHDLRNTCNSALYELYDAKLREK